MNEGVRCEFAWGALLLRVALGLLFFTAGVAKFIGGPDLIVRMIGETFGKTWLPAFVYLPFAHVLPYCEVTFGTLIILGLFRNISLGLGSLLMLSLTFGMMIAPNSPTKLNVIGFNMFYVSLFVAAFLMSAWDRWTLDALFRALTKKR